jgi:hypothetical protein
VDDEADHSMLIEHVIDCIKALSTMLKHY